MSQLKGACIIGQSGGPTSVINASAYGVIRTALDSGCITKVYGAAHGIKGVLDDVLYDMGQEDAKELEYLLYTPSSALGSCRYKLKDSAEDDSDYKRILEIFKKYDVRYFFYNGGNDSMDTCNKISKYMQSVGYECRIMGATTCMEIYRDARVYDTGMVCVIEIMGRHAGWLTAASSLANISGEGPDLIYLPERDFDLNKFVEDVKAVYARSGKCIVAVSEGIHDSTGKLIAEYGAENAPVDAFGHKQLGGLASYLANYIKGAIGCKVRGIEFSLMQRCGAHLASLTDIQESFLSGKTAVLEAISGTTDKMVGFERKYDEKGSYVCGIKLMDLTDVANTEKKVPLEWINREGNNVNKEFIDYALPLIQGTPDRPLENGLPRFARLKKIQAK